jgi:two-component system LytT family response regulator
MPFGNAFDVLEATSEFSYETIFITAFSQYSLQALNKSASYYILKPIDIQELILAVNKVAESLENKEHFNRNKILLENLKLKPEKQQLILPTLQGFDVVKTEDILRLQADGNFTQVYLVDGSKKMVCRFLKHFDDLLEKPFVRVHRSHIINTNFVKSYHKNGEIVLKDGAEIEISTTFKDQFLALFK